MVYKMFVTLDAINVWNGKAIENLRLEHDEMKWLLGDVLLALDGVEFTYKRGVFESLVRAADKLLAPTSETALLTLALDRAKEIDPIIEEHGVTDEVIGEIEWWAMAYSAVALADKVDEETREQIYERIFSGDAEGALELARSAAKE